MTRKQTAMAACIGLVFVSTSCVVWESDYDALKQEFAGYKTLAEAREAKNQVTIQQLEDALRLENERVAALEKQIAALNAEKVALTVDKSRLQATEAELVKALREVQERKMAADKRIAEYRDLLARFKSLIDAGKLRVRIVDGQMVVELATDVLFPSGSAVLSPSGKAAVVEVAQVLAAIPERRYQIAGHTDDVPIRTARYRSNWDLAFDRAHSVLQAMLETGMPNTRISASSYGEYRPTADNASDEGKAKNRRIEIIVVPDLSQLPGAEELETLDPTAPDKS
jgi:chemotaxis protein MotB